MIDESIVYWILKLDDFKSVITVFAVLSGAFTIFLIASFMISLSCEDCENASHFKKYSLVGVIVFVLLLIANSFIPSTNQMLAIKVIPKITNNGIVEKLNADGKDVYELGVKAIKNKLSSMK